MASNTTNVFFLFFIITNKCTIHKENPTRCNNVSKFYYSIFIRSSTCFGRHTAHHQEPKTALAASGFAHVVRHSVPDNVHQLHVQQPSTYEKPEATSAVLGSSWWAVCRPKHVDLHINMEYYNFETWLQLVGIFFMNRTMVHGSTNIKASCKSFINKCLRKILRIFWPDQITNKELWKRTKPPRIDLQIRKRKWGWLGHTLQKPSDDTARQALRVESPRQTGKGETEEYMAKNGARRDQRS